jgi:hypothetical protein
MAPASLENARFDASTASRFADIALANVVREYPNQPAHVLDGPADALTPRALHPAFYGSYDWHSCVHMHWLLARLRRLFPDLPQRAAIDAVFDAHIAPAAIGAEVAYFHRPGTQSFERTYGWAWLLALATELARDATAERWGAALAPLSATIVERYVDFLPRARYPIRHGMHANSAFGLAFAIDYADVCAQPSFADALRAKAREWYEDDTDLPVAWEPSGADFLSPALMEAHLMQRVLPGEALAAWLSRALPGLANGQPLTLFEPATVTDRTDPQIVHLDGLNLSRAWCFEGIAQALDAHDARRARLLDAAGRHRAAGLVGVASGDYFGEHWLATFAMLASTGGPAR